MSSALILAAGTASRMGKLKQLVWLHDNYLLQHVINQVSSHPFESIHVIIGHEAALIKRTITFNDRRIHWIVNKGYLKGQSSSFLTGVESLSSSNSSFIVFLGDQPFIPNETIVEILQNGEQVLQKTKQPFVIRPVYQQKPGHPVFFGNYKQLDFQLVKGDFGGKGLIASIKNQQFLPVASQMIHFDIDTLNDLEEAKKMGGYV